MALSTTTLSAAVTAGASVWPLASSSGLSLPSTVAGLDPVCCLFCGGEAARVLGFLGANTVQVQRGLFGSPAGAHASASTVYLARPSDLYQADPVGVPPASPTVEPWINTITGTVWVVSGGAWVRSGAASSATAAYPATSTGTNTLLAASPVARTVSISVQVTAVFANGSGAQPTFAIGETGTVSKFAATSVFTNAANGATFSFSGTLSANAALIVTATAATGTATGALTITVLAV